MYLTAEALPPSGRTAPAIHGPTELAGHANENGVAHLVAEAVVDLLEVVGLEHEEGQGRLEEARKVFLEPCLVEEARELVPIDLALELPDEGGILLDEGVGRPGAARHDEEEGAVDPRGEFGPVREGLPEPTAPGREGQEEGGPPPPWRRRCASPP